MILFLPLRISCFFHKGQFCFPQETPARSAELLFSDILSNPIHTLVMAFWSQVFNVSLHVSLPLHQGWRLTVSETQSSFIFRSAVPAVVTSHVPNTSALQPKNKHILVFLG